MRLLIPALAASLLTGLSPSLAGWQGDGPGQSTRPSFSSRVAIVRIAATVQDRDGRPVLGLVRSDFEAIDDGEPRSILEFTTDVTPISVAILIDSSGSMSIPPKREKAQDAVHHLLSWLNAGADETALYAFSTTLTVMEPLAKAHPDPGGQLLKLDPFGQTSLYDAIAGASRAVADRRGARSAVVAITDGVDTSSQMDQAAVARLASTIDVPVYILLAEPLDRQPRPTRGLLAAADSTAPIEALSRSTGGRVFRVTGPASASLAARAIVTELRHQYVIGIAAGARAGWHPLIIRTRQKTLVVRARSGYAAGAPNGRP